MKNFKIWAWAVGATLILAGCQNSQDDSGPIATDPSPTAATTGDHPAATDPATAAPGNPADPAAPAPQAPSTKNPAATTAPPVTTPPTASTAPPANAGARLLRLKVKKGDVYRYQFSSKMTGGSGPAAGMSMDATVRMAVDAVSGNDTTLRMTFERFDMPVLAQAPEEQRKQFENTIKKLAIIYVTDEKGNMKSVRSEGGPPGAEQAFGSLGSSGATASLPDGPVKVGDTYTSEHKVDGQTVNTTYKVLAFERKNGIDSVKLEMTAAVRNTTQTMYMWLELATGMLVAAEGEMPLPGQGDAKMTTSMRRL